ncbi:phosphate signaling complex protein PhoU [Gilvimarinus sp. F26214L]|uniref:phosphate signaling complex protein PhoU n=1 Tax=Gilvimarinus sp. DZF01 TaxID=3461371 RepID=UPI0040458C1C
MDKLSLDKHISQQFNSDLEGLKTQLLEMGGRVENQISDAIRSIEELDSGLAQRVLENEPEIDELEVSIDEQCTLVLAKRQPAASDLRMVLAVAKAVRDLERMGDEAQKVAHMAIALSEHGKAPGGFVELRHIGSGVLTMLRHALDAFARYDAEAALGVVREDQAVDRDYKTALRELVTYMMEDPRSISRVMNLLWALRSLERIGDHARNLAEHLIYLVKGKDVRHATLSEMEAQVRKP